MAIRFDGLDKILARIDNKTDFDEALQKSCALVERSAKEKAPKVNGELRRSITSKVENDEGIIYTPLEYAPYVEYGTGLFAEEIGRQDVPWNYKDDKGEWHSTYGMHPQPYMRPALYENRNKIIEIFREVIKNG